MTGRFLEPRMGRLRFGALIFFVPPAFGLTFLLLSRTPEMLVGTGGVMWALFGTATTLGLRGWSTLSRSQRAVVILSTVASLVAVLGLLSTPNSSRNGPIAVVALSGMLIGRIAVTGPAASTDAPP